jgi:O-antigen/teichoic acid export membrane protein/glycosyltransferase involved in cell wall biosynthesis
MPEHLTSRAFSALRWGYAGFATRAVATFASGIVLARLLGPKPFGQIAAATLVFGLANQLADGGFSSALVQAPELGETDVRFAFTLQLAIGAALTAFCALIAPAVGAALRDPLIGDVVRVTALVFLIQAFGQSSAALLKRRLAFRALQTAQVVSSVGGYALVGIAAALLGAGVWSLVAAQIAQSLTYSALVFIQARHSVIPCWSRPSLRLARFGMKVTGVNLLNWSISNFDNAFVGRAFGSTALGLYSRAFNTVSGPADAVVSTWQQVLFSSCSRIGDRTKASQRAYLASVSAVALITFPVFWSVAVCAPVVVAALYGPRWAEAAPLLRPLAIAITLNAVMAMAGPMLGAADQVKREVKAQALSLLVAIAAFSVCIHYSAVALAWAVVGVYVFRFFAATRPTLQLLGLEWVDAFRVLRGPVVMSCITAGAVWSAWRLASIYSIKPAWTLLGLGLTGIATLFILLLLAADHVLSRELVLVLTQLSGSLPAKLSQRLAVINSRQAARETWEREASENGAPPDVGASLFIATMLPPGGETGVQTHFNELCHYLEGVHVTTGILTPYGAPKALRISARAVCRVLGLFGRRTAFYASWHLDQALLWSLMRSRLPRKGSWTVYAQCPRSALAALQCRKTTSQRVVMIVHFNLSQADEMADRGCIKRIGLVYSNAQRGEQKALMGADGVVYCSAFMRLHLVSRIAGLAERPYKILPNFISPPVAAVDGPSGDIITIGTLEPRKNQMFLLHVLAAARRRGRSYSLTIVGRGEDELVLRAEAARLEIAGQIRFAGYVKEASSLIPRHKVYVHSARIENLPIVLIEAIAAGVPVLAPAVGGIPEIVTDGIDGYLWDLADVERSTSKLIGILDDGGLRLRMGAAGREKYNRRFRTECLAPQLYQFLVSGEGCGAVEPQVQLLSKPGAGATAPKVKIAVRGQEVGR